MLLADLSELLVDLIAAAQPDTHIRHIDRQGVAVTKLGNVAGALARDASNMLTLLLQRVKVARADGERSVEGLAPKWGYRLLHRGQAASLNFAAHRRPSYKEWLAAQQKASEALCIVQAAALRTGQALALTLWAVWHVENAATQLGLAPSRIDTNPPESRPRLAQNPPEAHEHEWANERGMTAGRPFRHAVLGVLLGINGSQTTPS